MITNLEYSVSPNFCKREEVTLLASEFEEAFNNPHSNKVLEHIIQLNIDEVENSGILSPICMRVEEHLTNIFNVSGISLAKVWFLKSQSKIIDPAKLPYIPHFDKHRFLKAMIYLHDVNNEHGPIHLGKLLSPSQIEVRRKNLPVNYKKLGLNTIKSCELKSGMMPILGSKGDVIFFDTNTAHCAGIVSKGFERHVIRFDFDVQGFNSEKSFVKRLFSAISSRMR